jgi:hypothetical protein
MHIDPSFIDTEERNVMGKVEILEIDTEQKG